MNAPMNNHRVAHHKAACFYFLNLIIIPLQNSVAFRL
jgi:hypothetical protein